MWSNLLRYFWIRYGQAVILLFFWFALIGLGYCFGASETIYMLTRQPLWFAFRAISIVTFTITLYFLIIYVSKHPLGSVNVKLRRIKE